MKNSGYALGLMHNPKPQGSGSHSLSSTSIKTCPAWVVLPAARLLPA